MSGAPRALFHSNDMSYVAHTFSGGVSLLAKQSDNRLLLDERITTGEDVRTGTHAIEDLGLHIPGEPGGLHLHITTS